MLLAANVDFVSLLPSEWEVPERHSVEPTEVGIELLSQDHLFFL